MATHGIHHVHRTRVFYSKKLLSRPKKFQSKTHMKRVFCAAVAEKKFRDARSYATVVATTTASTPVGVDDRKVLALCPKKSLCSDKRSASVTAHKVTMCNSGRNSSVVSTEESHHVLSKNSCHKRTIGQCNGPALEVLPLYNRFAALSSILQTQHTDSTGEDEIGQLSGNI